tara:strand:- start:11157 stop:11336 length:180 start_codon:yes stop_codon:yes gene_type:complete
MEMTIEEFNLPELDQEDIKKAQAAAEKDIKQETNETISKSKSPTRKLPRDIDYNRELEA